MVLEAQTFSRVPDLKDLSVWTNEESGEVFVAVAGAGIQTFKFSL
jgi:hypothetical protein